MHVRSTASIGGIVAAMFAMGAWAASGVMAKGIDLPGMAIILYRMWLYSAVVLAVLMMRGGRLSRAAFWAAAPGGLALGLDLALFFNAVKTTTIANATVIGALQPILMMVVVGRLLGERVRTRDLLFSLAAIVGVAVVMFGSAGLPDANPHGDLLAAGALVAFTGYFVFSKRTQGQMTPLQYTTATALWAALLNTPIAFLSGQEISLPSATNWFWLALLALVPGLIGHGLMNWSLTRIPVWLGGTLTLTIPVVSTLLAWAFIDEEVRLLQFGGMGIVIGALTVVVLARERPGRAAPVDAEAPVAPAPSLP